MFLAAVTTMGDSGVSPDAVLVNRLLQKDVRAFEELYDRHSRAVFGLVLRILQQAGMAEEVVQDVFLQLWRNAGRYDEGRGPFVPWLFTLARNRALDTLRLKSERQRRREDQSEEWPPVASAPPEFERQLDERRRAEKVRGAQAGPGGDIHGGEGWNAGNLNAREIADAAGRPGRCRPGTNA